jgi:hypothetical protein
MTTQGLFQRPLEEQAPYRAYQRFLGDVDVQDPYFDREVVSPVGKGFYGYRVGGRMGSPIARRSLDDQFSNVYTGFQVMNPYMAATGTDDAPFYDWLRRTATPMYGGRTERQVPLAGDPEYDYQPIEPWQERTRRENLEAQRGTAFPTRANLEAQLRRIQRILGKTPTYETASQFQEAADAVEAQARRDDLLEEAALRGRYGAFATDPAAAEAAQFRAAMLPIQMRTAANFRPAVGRGIQGMFARQQAENPDLTFLQWAINRGLLGRDPEANQTVANQPAPGLGTVT